MLLRARTGHDFSAYKANTIRRRIERRINVHQLKGPQQYLRLLHENPHELDLLFRELLIGVTNFFRDPGAFEALAKTALPGLLAARAGRRARAGLGAGLFDRRGGLFPGHGVAGADGPR